LKSKYAGEYLLCCCCVTCCALHQVWLEGVGGRRRCKYSWEEKQKGGEEKAEGGGWKRPCRLPKKQDFRFCCEL